MVLEPLSHRHEEHSLVFFDSEEHHCRCHQDLDLTDGQLGRVFDVCALAKMSLAILSSILKGLQPPDHDIRTSMSLWTKILHNPLLISWYCRAKRTTRSRSSWDTVHDLLCNSGKGPALSTPNVSNAFRSKTLVCLVLIIAFGCHRCTYEKYIDSGSAKYLTALKKENGDHLTDTTWDLHFSRIDNKHYFAW